MLDFLMNGVITLSVSCILDHPAPSWRCLWMRIMAPLLDSPKQCFCNVTHWRTVSGLSNFLSESVAFFEHGSAVWRREMYSTLQRHCESLDLYTAFTTTLPQPLPPPPPYPQPTHHHHHHHHCHLLKTFCRPGKLCIISVILTNKSKRSNTDFT